SLAGARLSEEWDRLHQADDLLWRRILDFTSARIGLPNPVNTVEAETLKEQVENDFDGEWKQLDNAPCALLDAIQTMDDQAIVRIFESTNVEGYRWALNQIKQYNAPRPSKRRSHLGLSATYREASAKDWDTENMLGDDAVSYILELGKLCAEYIKNDNSDARTERDLDVNFHVGAFKQIKNTTNANFGELESRASRDRRIAAAIEVNKSTKNIRGQYCDWLFHIPGSETDEAYGVEVSAVANVGSRRGRTKKFVSDRKGMAVLLRDIHRAFALRTLSARPKRDEPILKTLLAKFSVAGLVTNKTRYELVGVEYLESGWYAAITLAAFDAPSTVKGFVSEFASFARWMCRYNNFLMAAVGDMKFLLAGENHLPDDEIVKGKFWEAPRAERSAKRG
ncbi:hypothetical protein HK104_001218, partial [Borealophlyctis nickersoniae]